MKYRKKPVTIEAYQTDKEMIVHTLDGPLHASVGGNHAIAFVGTSGVQLGWLASQSDMLAEDWQIVK